MSPPENSAVSLEAFGAATVWAGCPALEAGALAPPPPFPDAPLVPPPEAAVPPLPVAFPPPATLPAVVPLPPGPPPVTGVCVSGATPWYWAWELDWAWPAAGAPRAIDAARRGRQIRLRI